MTAASTTIWYIDIHEVWEDMRGNTRIHEFSVPLTFGGPWFPGWEQDMSLAMFIDTINHDLAQASDPTNWTSPEPSYGNRETWVTYKLTAPYARSAAFNNSDPDFAIQYHFNVDPDSPYDAPGTWGTLRRFTLQFRDGPHGYDNQVGQGEPHANVPRANIRMKNNPNTRAAVLPYSSHVATILDKPPVPPNVEVVPYVGVNNKILFLLNSNVGEYSARPVAILDADNSAIADQYVAQTGNPINPEQVPIEIANPSSTLKIEYRSDDPITQYQAFRIESKPEGYPDFNTISNPWKVVTGDITVDKKSSAAFLIDDIEPNTKYYYCFRAIDVHNNFSNPTHVYEVEMVDNDGQVFLILNTIFFNQQQEIVRKGARRYIYIEPSMRNLQIPDSALPVPESAITDNPNPGAPIFQAIDSGQSCWNKTFKVRLTSKKSGKKIDLNILFKNTGVVNP
tara:strand:- start:480 stop:1832 length:1353 start_codon:yes stop_codon:yes gene_type:complete